MERLDQVSGDVYELRLHVRRNVQLPPTANGQHRLRACAAFHLSESELMLLLLRAPDAQSALRPLFDQFYEFLAELPEFPGAETHNLHTVLEMDQFQLAHNERMVAFFAEWSVPRR